MATKQTHDKAFKQEAVRFDDVPILNNPQTEKNETKGMREVPFSDALKQDEGISGLYRRTRIFLAIALIPRQTVCNRCILLALQPSSSSPSMSGLISCVTGVTHALEIVPHHP